jgi:hypothetical protein
LVLRDITVLHSANKKYKVSSVRSLEDDATAEILLFKGFGDDVIISDSGSSKSETSPFCQNCRAPLHPGMCDMKYHS